MYNLIAIHDHIPILQPYVLNNVSCTLLYQYGPNISTKMENATEESADDHSHVIMRAIVERVRQRGYDATLLEAVAQHARLDEPQPPLL